MVVNAGLPSSPTVGGKRMPWVMAIKKRFVFGALAAAVLVIGGAWGWRAWRDMDAHAKTDNAYVRANITPVTSKVEGYVREVRVKDNAWVKAGEVVAVLDDSDLKARMAKAEATVRRARAEIAARQSSAVVVQRQVGAQGDVVAQAQAALEAAKAEVARVDVELARYRPLFEKGIVSKAKIDQLEAQRAVAEAQAKAASAQVSYQRDQGGIVSETRTRAGADTTAAEAAMAAAEADLVAAKLDLERTLIRAPTNGIVAARTVQEGQLVRPGIQLLAIVPTHEAFVIANFKETQIARMVPGQRTVIRVDAYPGKVFLGEIESLSPASGAQFSLLPTDTASGNFTKITQRVPVKIRILPGADPQGLLKAGLSVVVSVDLESGPPEAVAVASQ
jgi:membrane fusion protein, multidrug efflux system